VRLLSIPQGYRITRLHADEPRQTPVPKLESLTISDTDLYTGAYDLLDLVKQRHEHNLGLKNLTVRSCWTEFEDVSKLREVVNEVGWDDNNGDEEEEKSDEDEPEEVYGSDDGADVDLCEPQVHVF